MHIEANHGKRIRGAGFGSVEEFIAHVAKAFGQIWQATGSQLLAAYRDGQQHMMYVQLEPARDESGDFYRVNSAFPVRQEDYPEKHGFKKLWDGSEPASAVAGEQPAFAGQSEEISGQTTPNARGQSNQTIADAEKERKPASQWLHDEIVLLINRKGHTDNRKALDRLVDLLKRAMVGEDVKPGKVKSFLPSFKGDEKTLEIAQRVHDRMKADSNKAAAEARKAAKDASPPGRDTAHVPQPRSGFGLGIGRPQSGRPLRLLGRWEPRLSRMLWQTIQATHHHHRSTAQPLNRRFLIRCH